MKHMYSYRIMLDMLIKRFGFEDERVIWFGHVCERCPNLSVAGQYHLFSTACEVNWCNEEP